MLRLSYGLSLDPETRSSLRLDGTAVKFILETVPEAYAERSVRSASCLVFYRGQLAHRLSSIGYYPLDGNRTLIYSLEANPSRSAKSLDIF